MGAILKPRGLKYTKILIFSGVGLLAQEVKISTESYMTIALAPGDKSLDEVIVVGLQDAAEVFTAMYLELFKSFDLASKLSMMLLMQHVRMIYTPFGFTKIMRTMGVIIADKSFVRLRCVID
jgi:hypothetical protein